MFVCVACCAGTALGISDGSGFDCIVDVLQLTVNCCDEMLSTGVLSLGAAVWAEFPNAMLVGIWAYDCA